MSVRPSPIAGSWYPGNLTTLAADLDRYLDNVSVPAFDGHVWGVVAPHAGYRFSAQVAAYAFKCLEGRQVEVVVVLSPLHQLHHARLLTTGFDSYQTPLGLVSVDHAAVRALDQAIEERLGHGLVPLSYDLEHAVEIELPFLQHVLGSFQLVPIMIRDQRGSTCRALGEAMAETFAGRSALFVASSDLSHFYPQNLALELDEELLRRVEAFDPDAVVSAEEEGAGFACGRGAIAATLWATRLLGANRVNVLRHATSGDISGNYDAVVGYGSCVIWQSETPSARSNGGPVHGALG